MTVTDRTRTTTGLKLGKGDAVRPVGLLDLKAYTPTGFPAAPPTFGDLASLQAVAWGMDGNDTLGDCTIAGADHLIANGNALEGTNDPRPTLADLEAQYKVLSPNDTGCVEANVLQVWRTSGLFSGIANKIGLYAPVNHRDQDEICQVVAFTGGIYLGINCPDSAQQQFSQQSQSGQLVPWTVVPGAQIEGGHCIVGVGYTAEGLYCVTWGAVVLVTWAFMTQYCDEGWALLSEELAEKGSDQFGLNVTQLQSDLNGLAA
jgi:hypothetical protein